MLPLQLAGGDRDAIYRVSASRTYFCKMEKRLEERKWEAGGGLRRPSCRGGKGGVGRWSWW